MHITGSHYRLIKLLSQLNDLLIDLNQVFLRVDGIILLILDHKPVISQRLDLQIIIKIHQSCDLRLRCIPKQCLVKLTGLAGASNEQSIPVCFKYTLGNSWLMVKIFDMGLAYQLVQIDPACFITHKDHGMISRQLFDGIRRNLSLFIQLIHIKNISFPAHFHKFLENTCRTLCIIHCSVVMIQRHTGCLCHSIQLETVQGRKKEPGHANCIHISKIMGYPQPVAVFNNKAHIKISIMGYHGGPFTKFQKLWQNFLDLWRFHNHCITNTGKLLDTKWDRHFRIYKGGKTVCDLSSFYQHCTDLNDPAGKR